ncbi:MAG: hypothetical protein JRI80_18870 [Deltaproteobacteria bacterium]|nr:hypothetical protein [Deltaproteobacteria bacterium]
MRRTVLCAAVLLLFLYGIPGMSNAAELPDIFGLEVGNTWLYQSVGSDGPYTALDKITTTEPHMSTTIYVMERSENGVRTERQWLERKPGEVKLWGGTADFDGATYTMQFSTGLVQVWYPMHVGESKCTSTRLTIEELTGHVFHASMAVDVVGKKRVALSSGTVTGYKIRYQMRIWGYGMDETATFVQWWVPYLGYVKYEDLGTVDKLVSFSIGGGSITQDAESDILIEAMADPVATSYGGAFHSPTPGSISLVSKKQ